MRTLVAVCLAGLALRLVIAAQPGMVYPDEHFQTLEVANWAVNGFGYKAWEWAQGARSWITPAVFMPVLWLAKIFGAVGGPVALAACRALAAALSMVAVWMFHRLLVEGGRKPAAATVATALFALSPAMAVWACTTFSETLSLAALWITMPFALRFVDDAETRPARWVLAGFLAAVPFLIRLQMAFWAMGLFVTWVALYRPEKNKILAVSSGYIVGVFVYGLVDLMTWGTLFHSVRTYYRVNVSEGFLGKFGNQPFYHYVLTLWDSPGAFPVIAIAAVLIAAAALRVLRFQRRDALVLIPVAIFFVIHSFIPHKETRFILPAVPALFYLLAIGLDGLLGHFKAAFVAVFLAAGMAVSWATLDLKEFYGSWDISDLSVSMYRHGLLKSDPSACVGFVDQFLFWSRGEMVLGRAVRIVDKTIDTLTATDLEQCRYAVVGNLNGNGAAVAARFEQLYGAQWKRLERNPRGHMLYFRQP